MADHARSASPAVQHQLDRLSNLSPGRDTLGLERITALLDRLGNPERRLPPVFHVAGTNGKGSTCAFLRAILEAAGLRVHAYTSPHLVRFNERIRLAGSLIEDDLLAATLAQVLDGADDIGPSFFEATTAAAFLAFSHTPADACVVEVGLGGRLDATNVLEAPAACGIAQLGIDHEAFLGNMIEGIAAEKAGIARGGVPLMTLAYPANVMAPIVAAADKAGAELLSQDHAWSIERTSDGLGYRDRRGSLALPTPSLAGPHQMLNAGLAVAMIRHQGDIVIPESAFAAGLTSASWPARMQRLAIGPLPASLPPGSTLWLDGGHNPAAAGAIADFVAGGERVHLILGMLGNKDASGFLAPLAGVIDRLTAVPVEDHEHHAPETLALIAAGLGIPAGSAPDVTAALAAVRDPQTVLIAGSLYLAGSVLSANGAEPA